ncbi:hypothetical protein [Glycomyces buryatensis]|uniref:Uncharacterized protein n=1 Tax=Glycomyces buryatensis TaxID=2570927 RepID=A0A4S8QAP2_9ACTN|nr:hypothetical protein [Glycomyces buryatensis]THV41398.1 hypothetical protein FAB82_11395 [Glycomyces buryatensis]
MSIDSLELSAVAFRARQSDSPSGWSPVRRNYAAVRLADGTVLTARSIGKKPVEIELLERLASRGASARIVEIYSERQPSVAAEVALTRAGVDPGAVSYTAEFFDMEGEPTADDLRELALLNNASVEVLRAMIRDAEGFPDGKAEFGPFAATVDAVGERLGRAGYVVFPEQERGTEPGVEIVVDQLEDEGRGVYLSWFVGEPLNSRVVQAFADNQLDDSALAEAGEIKQHKLHELAVALMKERVLTEDLQDNCSPYTLRVTGIR